MSRICDEFDSTLKDMLADLESNGPIKETLSSFIGQCAGVPVNEKEMISDVNKGLKSYEKNMNDFCALGSVLKRSRRANTYLAYLDDGQLKGFKLQASEVTENVTKAADTVVEITPKVKQRKNIRKKEVKQPKLVLSFKKTDQNAWVRIEEPQKIVPIYSERISGRPGRRNNL